MGTGAALSTMALGFSSDSARLNAALARWFSEMTHAGMFATDAELRLIAWNRWMEIHTRRPAAEVIGQPLLQLFPDLVSRGIDARYADALNDGRVSTLSNGLHGYVLAMPPTSPDLGAEMPQNGRITPLRDGDAIVGTLTVIENVSERLASEAELRKQIAAQQAARAIAERALRDKDEFLSTLSHELRTPLNAVLGWTRIILSRKETNPINLRALQIIERNAMSQAAMIDDILDVARMVSGKLRLDMAPTDLAQVVSAAVDVITPSASAKRIKVSTALDELAPLVLGDPGRLQQIIWNLLSNAVKFTEQDGDITVTLTSTGNAVRLVISDNGRGIAPEFLPYVFDRFRQGDPSSARRHGGLGLGLALVHDLVELHGGTIRAESAGMQCGAVFTVELPVLTEDTPSRPAAPTPTRASSNDLLEAVRILVVEDEADARELLAAALARCGADVVAVSSCEEALAQLHAQDAQPFAAMVSDIGMPNQDGYDLIRQIRALNAREVARIPALAVTAYATEGDRERARIAGYNAHVAKPVDLDALAAEVLRAIHNASMSGG